MSEVMFHKAVAALPPELEADSVYYVRVGSGYTQYVTNSSGVIVAYEQNVYLPEAAEVAVTDAGNFFVSNDVEGVLQELGSDVGNIEASLDGKVDVVAGKQLSDQNYTLAEKNKLSILENYDDTAVLSSLNNKVDKVGGKQLSDENYTLVEKDKLSGVEEDATQNSTDSFLLDRSNHTGTQAISTVSGLSATLNSKVDAVEGMGLSQENFTTQEKDKLSLLEEPMFKGMFSSYAELIAAYPTAQAGNYAQVAGAPGEPSTTYSWDVVTGEWVEQVPEASPEQIKQLYESNPDTNAFTDSEKSKLAGVATGATANQGTVTSVGLSLPTGLSVSGTPVTDEGVLAVTYSAGYSIPTNTKQGQWDSAYGWGNHANAGYLTEVTWADVQDKPTTFMPVIGDTANTAVAGNDARLEDVREWTALTVPQAEAEAGTAVTRRAWTSQRVRQAIVAWWNNSSDKTKLDGIATGATANATDAQLRDRATHTGVQAISTITGLQGALDGKVSVVVGKGLSTNDFTNEYKTALDNIPITYVTKVEFNATIGDIGAALDGINGEVV